MSRQIDDYRPSPEIYAELVAKNERLRAVLWWVEEYSNDPGVVQRVRDELKKIGQ